MSKKNKSTRTEREPYLLRNKKTKEPTTFDTPQVDSTPPTLRASDGATSGNLTGEASSTIDPILSTPGCTTHTTHCSFTSAKDKMAPPVPTMDTDLLVSHSDFVKTTERIIEKLDTLNANVSAIRKEVSEMRANMSDLQAAVADSSERLTAIESDVLPKMHKKNENLENELKQMIMTLELHDRKMNLLIYGVEKKKDERVLEVVRSVIHELGFSKEEAQSMFIANAHRLPRRVTPGKDERRGHDPIIVRFGAMLDRDAVLNAYQRVQIRPMTSQGQAAVRYAFRIVTDLPAPLKRKRFLLEQKAYQMRKNENKSTRIKLNGVNLHLECREKGSSSAWRIVLD